MALLQRGAPLALLICLCFVVAGCNGTNGKKTDDNSADNGSAEPDTVEIDLPADIPMPADFTLAQSNPPPFARGTGTPGGMRSAHYAFIHEGAYGLERVVNHFKTALRSEGWDFLDDRIAARGVEWTSEWSKDYALRITYTEIADRNNPEKVLSRIEVRLNFTR